MKMENNQEHKIDRIFKKSLENQLVVPPTDAWMGIHTYTIGQEESKKKIWVKYVILASLLLIFVGFGLLYLSDNQPIIVKNDIDLKSKKLLVDNGGKLSVKTQTTANAGKLSVEIHTTTIDLGKSSVKTQTTGQQFKKWQLGSSIAKLSTIKRSIKNEPLIVEIEDDSVSYGKEEFVYPVGVYHNINLSDLKTIRPKSLILNDLYNKIHKESEEKIITLGENLDNKNTVFHSDSVDYGNRFSLRHPIITFGVGSMRSFWGFRNFLGFGSSNGLRINLPTYLVANGITVKIGTTWKVNKKLRLGLSLAINSFNLDIPRGFFANNNTSNIYLFKEFEGKSYTDFTPFGFINIPVSTFKNFPTTIPNTLDSVRIVQYPYSHSMRVTALSVTSQYNLLSKNRKVGKKYGYQIYGLGDLIIQRQTGYSYASLDEKEYLDGLKTSPNSFRGYIFHEGNHLQEASEYTFGLRIGLGFRYQFARKWDFYVEGSGQETFNSWIEESNLNQRAISIQTGINLNL